KGIELYRKGDFNGAVKALQKAVKTHQSDSDAWYYLGLSLRRVDKIKDAGKAFEKTISLRPDFAPAYTGMAYMQLLGNDNNEALKNAEKALALDPKNFESHYIAGVVRLRQGKHAEALARAGEALNIKSDYPPGLLLKTQALLGVFAEERAKLVESRNQREGGKSAGDVAGVASRHADYSLLNSASKSLEAYLKLGLQEPNRDSLREQLEELRFYGQRAVGSGSDNFVTPNDSVSPMTATLRPTIVYKEKARYTEAANAAGVTGTVILLAVFGEDGILKHILAIQGLSHGLTEEAIKAARKIRFKPAMRNGKPVSVFGSLEFTFNLGR
ncbi:MAG TPA: tetratricopeptide repeat protein, partial [Blastocatellia bacterium]|nr:tetratricopeptide repeat protein [Blastocatellia bacterium]